MSICWDFPFRGTGNQQGSNNAAITMFAGSGVMDGLAREVCQNSLDAKDRDLGDDVPVKVKFSLSYIDRDSYEVFSGYETALDGCFDYWENHPDRNQALDDFLNTKRAYLNQTSIPVLTMSDYNTIGLEGVNPLPGQKSYWNLLANTEGLSGKQDDSSGGSFGIGKFAPFAYSGLNMVFYNTFAKDGGRALQGVTHLVTSQRPGEDGVYPTSATGKYLYLINPLSGRGISPDDNCPLAELDCFAREEHGTDVSIFGFKLQEYEGWEVATAVAIIKNFILAIRDGKLEAIVESPSVRYEISSAKLEELLFSVFRDQQQLKYTRQIFETVNAGERTDVKIAEEGDLSIYVRYEDRYSQSFSRFRTTGMLINTTADGSLPHFSVVVVANDVGEKKLSKVLRETEPPQHTEWKAKNITDNPTLKNRAYSYLRKIRKAVQGVLDEYDLADLGETMDAGIGSYIPDSSDSTGLGEGTDGLKTDVKVKSIVTKDGRTIHSSQFQSGATAIVSKSSSPAVKTGKKKRKKRTGGKIPVVSQGRGTEKGAAPSSGQVKISQPNIVDHRTFLIAGAKYKLHVESDKDYKNVFIHYSAGREDDKQDALVISSYKQDGMPLVNVSGDRIGPISLHRGGNDLFIDFADKEVMAVSPVFTMEVCDGC